MSSEPPAVLPSAWFGRTEVAWAEDLGVPRLEIRAELTSTSDRLRSLAEAGAPHFTCVVAGAQTRGRGRGGRAWHSAPNSGLWISILLPSGEAGFSNILPLAVGVAVARALERFAPDPVGLKWPNDLLVGSDKVAGILCEATGDPAAGVVVGIGVNLRRPPEGMPEDLASGVAFLEELAGTVVAEPALARTLVGELGRWLRPAPHALEGRLRQEWERRDSLVGHAVQLESGLRGVAKSVAADGALEVLLDDGRPHRVRSGSVRLDAPGASPALHHFARERAGPREE